MNFFLRLEGLKEIILDDFKDVIDDRDFESLNEDPIKDLIFDREKDKKLLKFISQAIIKESIILLIFGAKTEREELFS